MIFKGIKFKKSRTVVALPRQYWTNNQCYVTFGKTCPASAQGAIKTDYVFEGSREPVYAKPIDVDFHSLTNLAYGHIQIKDNGIFKEQSRAVYLLESGRVYTAKKCL